MTRRITALFITLATTCGLYAQENLDKDEKAHADTCVHLNEVVVTSVTGSAHIREIAAPVNVLSHAVLRTRQSTNIIDAISHLPGINQITTGSGISKPVIRGLGYNRVLVVSDGIRQEGQQWGDEHGIEIDGQGVHSVEIIKGPASLMYGSDAMAGVIIMHDDPVMPRGSTYTEAETEYQSNNGLAAYTVNQRGNQNGIVWDWRWSQKWAHDYNAPQDGYVPGSRFHNSSLKGLLGWGGLWGYSHARMSYYYLIPGMTEVEDEYTEGGKGYSIKVPFQKVRHWKGVLDNHFNLKAGYIKAIMGYQQNRRQEFEEIGKCGLDFRLHTVNYDLRYVSPKWRGWKTNFGIGGMYQKSENLGDQYLIPAYNLFDIGTFATVSRNFREHLHLSGGLRYDHRKLHSLAQYDDGRERFTDFHRKFGAMSGSIGAIYNLNTQFDLKANISHGYRAPNISELGSNGMHEGTFRYETGNTQLKEEHSWQFDLGADYAGKIISTSVALFANRISNYIFLYGTGEEYDRSPIYRFTAGDARLMGGEAKIIVHIQHHLHYENAFSYVNARLTSVDNQSGLKWLPFTPQPRWLTTLHYDIPVRKQWIRGLFVQAEVDLNFCQTHVMSAGDTETPTPAYTLLNISAGTDIHLPNGKKLCSILANATNLLDKAYISHLSRLKYADTLPLTGRSGINNMGRNIGVRILFPIEISKL